MDDLKCLLLTVDEFLQDYSPQFYSNNQWERTSLPVTPMASNERKCQEKVGV